MIYSVYMLRSAYLLPDHFPKVITRILYGTLCRDVVELVLIALELVSMDGVCV